MLKVKSFHFILVAVILLTLAINVYAADEQIEDEKIEEDSKEISQILIGSSKEELKPYQEIKITIKTVDESAKIVEEDTRVFITFSQGNVLNTDILADGLLLEAGKGSFNYIAPEKTGEVEIFIIAEADNLFANYSLDVVEQIEVDDWEEEYAKVNTVQGSAVYKSADEESWTSILSDVKLYQDYKIKTWGDSWVEIELFDGSELTIEPLSTVKIQSLRSSASDSEIKESRFKVFVGGVLARASGYARQGARFEIESESTAAGVRGTFFEYSSSFDGVDDLIVYDGEVTFEYPSEQFASSIGAGERVSVSSLDFVQPEVTSHDITSGMRQETLKEEQEAAQKRSEEIELEEELEESTLGRFTPEASNFAVFSQTFDGDLYLGFGLQPEFEEFLDSNFNFGLDLILYQDPKSNSLTLMPAQDNLNLFKLLNWLEYDGELFYLSYNELKDITYGHGLLMGNYSKENAKGLQLGTNDLSAFELDLRYLLPLDFKSIYPLKTEDTSTLHSFRLTSSYLELDLMPLQIGATVVNDFNDDLSNLSYDVPTWGLGADISLPLTLLTEPYLELSTLDSFGSGAELGVRGQLSSNLWYQTGLRAVGEKFKPNYFGNNYEELKEQSLLGDDSLRQLPDLSQDYSAAMGVYFNIGSNLFEAIDFSFGYEEYSSNREDAPVLSSRLMVDTYSLSVLPDISAGFEYRQSNFNQSEDRFLNQNTDFSWHLTYPITSEMSITLNNTYLPGEDETNYNREISFMTRF